MDVDQYSALLVHHLQIVIVVGSLLSIWIVVVITAILLFCCWRLINQIFVDAEIAHRHCCCCCSGTNCRNRLSEPIVGTSCRNQLSESVVGTGCGCDCCYYNQRLLIKLVSSIAPPPDAPAIAAAVATD